MLAQDTAPDNYGPTVGTGQRQGNNQGNAATPSMEVDGHQIYYDLRNELKVADWQAQGMKEVSFPLPGRRELMVCALEIVATRGSGGCRLVQPGDKVIIMAYAQMTPEEAQTHKPVVLLLGDNNQILEKLSERAGQIIE